MIKSAYIHIPFCQNICTYCDFCKFYYDQKMVSPYLESLEQEIKENYSQEILKTIYIGGGTPSSLSIEELRRLLKILSIFRKEENYEYTVECNIENITEEKVALLSSFGVNRISIGVQTFQEKYLSFLNRKHTRKEVFEKVEMVKKFIKNINVDLIYALPGETLEELEDDLNLFLSLKIPHISTYSLMIEEHTILHNKGVNPIEEDLDLEMYRLIEKKLSHFHHYEISNFSLYGYESKHNLTYWNNEEYYGFGLGASGYVNGIRYENTRSLNHYRKEDRILESHLLKLSEKMENEFILGFRKLEGISISKFIEKYQINPLDNSVVQKLLEMGKLENKNEFLRIPEKYLYTSNDILIHFINWDNEVSYL